VLPATVFTLVVWRIKAPRATNVKADHYRDAGVHLACGIGDWLEQSCYRGASGTNGEPFTVPRIEIVRSVKLAEIDPVFFETSYYVVPDHDAR
jgi:hypothetical protein